MDIQSHLDSNTLQAIIQTLRSEFAEIFGEQMVSLLLFGSRARGTEHPDSDIDIVVVLRGDFNYSDAIRMTSDVVHRLSLLHEVVISRIFVSEEQFGQEKSPLMLNIHREGIPA